MRITDDHDEARAVARYGLNGALAASALMFTLDGVPLLYNGMEVGDATESGDPALFDKLPIFWDPKERPPLREHLSRPDPASQTIPRLPQRPRRLAPQFGRNQARHLPARRRKGRICGGHQFFQPAAHRPGRTQERRGFRAGQISGRMHSDGETCRAFI